MSLFDAYNNTEKSAPTTNGHAKTNGHTNGSAHEDSDIVMSGTDTNSSEYINGAPSPPLKRSASPPPQLPAFIGAGAGLGLPVEDIFKNFN